jgi:hypothetical protein
MRRALRIVLALAAIPFAVHGLFQPQIQTVEFMRVLAALFSEAIATVLTVAAVRGKSLERVAVCIGPGFSIIGLAFPPHPSDFHQEHATLIFSVICVEILACVLMSCLGLFMFAHDALGKRDKDAFRQTLRSWFRSSLILGTALLALGYLPMLLKFLSDEGIVDLPNRVSNSLRPLMLIFYIVEAPLFLTLRSRHCRIILFPILGVLVPVAVLTIFMLVDSLARPSTYPNMIDTMLRLTIVIAPFGAITGLAFAYISRVVPKAGFRVSASH